MKWTVLDMRVSNLEKNVTMLEATMTYWSMTGEVLDCVSQHSSMWLSLLESWVRCTQEVQCCIISHLRIQMTMPEMRALLWRISWTVLEYDMVSTQAQCISSGMRLEALEH